ncbi:hypothetical protein KR054_009546, partial [Drosophila jambulina]
KANPAEPEPGCPWSTVARKKRQKTRSRPDAVVVEAAGKTYSEILAMVTRRDDSQLSDLGGAVKTVRRTARGNLLLEVARGGTESAESMRASISRVLGDAAEVRALTEESKVSVFVIRNLDAITTESEIRNAFSKQFDLCEGAVKIRSLRSGYAESKTAVISLPSSMAKEVRLRGEVRIGWTRCRVREREGPPPAQDLLMQTVREIKADVAILSEPYRVREGGEWAKDRSGKAALWLCGDGQRRMSNIFAADGFVRAEVSGYSASIIDLTYVSSAISHDARWSVSDVYTGSDHEAILCTVGAPEGYTRSSRRPTKAYRPD